MTSAVNLNEIAGLPPAQPPRPVQVPELPTFALANGLQLVVAPRRGTPLVTALLLARRGNEADPAGRAGLAGMTAAVLAKGARRGGRAWSAPEIARAAEALGASLDGGSGWRSATLGMTVTTPRLAPALALMADVIAAPTLAADELDRARSQTLDGLRVALADPGSVADLAARRAFWGASAYGASATPASLPRLTRADLVACHRQTWQPATTTLVLAGDVAPEDAQRLAERHFGAWKATPADAVALALAVPQPRTPPLVVIDLPGSGQGGVVVSAPFAALGAADRRAAQVAAAVLGGGYSARLNQEVRVRRGLSYGASGGGESHPEGGLFTAQAQTQPATALQVWQLMRGELLRLAEAPPTADELAARQATLVGGFARRLETTGGLASLVAAQLSAGRPLADLSRTVDEILAVTPAQVQAYAQKTWTDDSLRGVIVVDAKAAGASLADAPAPLLRLAMGELDLESPALRRNGG